MNGKEEITRKKYVLLQSEIAIGTEEDVASLDEIYERVTDNGAITAEEEYSREDLEEDINTIEGVSEAGYTKSNKYFTLNNDIDSIEPDMSPIERSIERMNSLTGVLNE